ncbi:MAG: response regulator [Verrucomicrobiota bacterium]|nr:response regulator [Verrucomicrobiota bacterium]
MRASCETVLLVEDEPMLRELGTMMLESLGYSVFAAEHGVDALRIIQEHPDVRIDLLLTDVAMPQMGGQELAEKLRALSPHTRVIFCSGYADRPLLPGGREPTVSFLDKPYNSAAVAQKIRDVFGARG